jgi:hypothetical protein
VFGEFFFSFSTFFFCSCVYFFVPVAWCHALTEEQSMAALQVFQVYFFGTLATAVKTFAW